MFKELEDERKREKRKLENPNPKSQAIILDLKPAKKMDLPYSSD